MPPRSVVLVGVALGLTTLLTGCGDDAPDATGTPPDSPAASATSSGVRDNPCLGEGGPAEAPRSGPDTDVYLGLTEEQAERAASDGGFTLRVAGRDGECYALTMDYRTDRVNVYLADGVVAAATIG